MTKTDREVLIERAIERSGWKVTPILRRMAGNAIGKAEEFEATGVTPNAIPKDAATTVADLEGLGACVDLAAENYGVGAAHLPTGAGSLSVQGAAYNTVTTILRGIVGRYLDDRPEH